MLYEVYVYDPSRFCVDRWKRRAPKTPRQESPTVVSAINSYFGVCFFSAFSLKITGALCHIGAEAEGGYSLTYAGNYGITAMGTVLRPQAPHEEDVNYY